MSRAGAIPTGEALQLVDLIAPTPHGIASRVLAKTGGNVTLLPSTSAKDLGEHTAPFDALVLVLDGAVTLVIDRTPVVAVPVTRSSTSGPTAVYDEETLESHRL